jgi:uncharacterized protein
MPDAERVRALVSAHDVMPETLDRVQRVLDLCAASNPGPLTLLVVPGRAWDRSGLERLRAWQGQGHRLAGHGWVHRVEGFGGVAHRLHGWLISRRVAEHLALDGPAIAALLRRCHAWFPERGLGPPDLYVPPAWALGPLRPDLMSGLPFERLEVLRGVLERKSGRLMPIPLLGYEADTRARTPVLRLWNRINRDSADRRGWVRIGIHPRDPELALAADLEQDLRRYPHWVDYRALAGIPD